MAGTTRHAEDLDASGLTIAIVWARFNEHITSRLRDAAAAILKDRNVASILEYDVPGAFELPYACKVLLASPDEGVLGRVDRPRAKVTAVAAVVALGCVIRGDTPHFEYVSSEVARGLMDVQLATRVPIGFGVLTCDDEEQAYARAGLKGNKGAEAALTAIEMAHFAREIGESWNR